MGFLRPVAMTKIGLVGLKDDRDRLLTALHDLGIVQVEPIRHEALVALDPERTSDVQRTVGDQLIRFRGLRAALPPVPGAAARAFPTLATILNEAKQVPVDTEVGDLKREEDRLLTERKSLSDDLEVLERFRFYSDRLEYLTTKNVLSLFGEAPREVYAALKEEIRRLSEADFLEAPFDKSIRFIVALRTQHAEAAIRLAQQSGVTLAAAPRLSGTPAEAIPELVRRRGSVDLRLGQIRSRLAEIAREWYPRVAALEEALTIENRKLEVFTKLGAGKRTFAVEGWVPKRDLPRLESAVAAVAPGRTHLYPIATDEEPPTKLDNPIGVRWYEFFIRFYSLPQATEWDPTWIFAIVFPIFFGFMLGDWGYGLVILGFSLWMIGGFPGRQHVPGFLKNFLKRIMSPNGMRSLAFALAPGCLVAIVSGVIFNEFFGYHLLPTPYIDAASKVGASQLLLLAGYIGLAMVTLGFSLGALKEYFHHHVRGALGKVGGILFGWGIAIVGLSLIRHQLNLQALTPIVGVALGLVVAGLVLLLTMEGIQAGLLGLIEIVSHILSYTRLVGILLASVILTVVAFDIAHILPSTWGIGKVIVGAVIVLMIELFNIILGVFEPGIQGARLIFVEHFSKFYTGNGKEFRPFGSRRTYTTAATSAAGPLPAKGASPAP